MGQLEFEFEKYVRDMEETPVMDQNPVPTTPYIASSVRMIGQHVPCYICTHKTDSRRVDYQGSIPICPECALFHLGMGKEGAETQREAARKMFEDQMEAIGSGLF